MDQRRSHTRGVDHTIDVSHAVDLPGPLHTAVSVHLPATTPERPVVMFAFPGGGYSRGYFDIRRDELDGPTQVGFHTQRGFIVVACDHLGVGESSQPDPSTISFEHLAAANHATVTAVTQLLSDGGLDPSIPAHPPSLVVGVGHSMGGCIGIIQQARFRSFEALAVLGYSGARMKIPEPPDGVDRMRYAFHWDEEPASLVDADLGPDLPPWRSESMPACVPSMANSGLIVDQAAAVDVPLFVAAGERDVLEDLHREPEAFRAASDITLFQLRRSAHMHNFAPTRRELWDRLHRWVESIRPADDSPAVDDPTDVGGVV